MYFSDFPPSCRSNWPRKLWLLVFIPRRPEGHTSNTWRRDSDPHQHKEPELYPRSCRRNTVPHSLFFQLTSAVLTSLHWLCCRAHYFSFHPKLVPAGEGQNIDGAKNVKLWIFFCWEFCQRTYWRCIGFCSLCRCSRLCRVQQHCGTSSTSGCQGIYSGLLWQKKHLVWTITNVQHTKGIFQLWSHYAAIEVGLALWINTWTPPEKCYILKKQQMLFCVLVVLSFAAESAFGFYSHPL